MAHTIHKFENSHTGQMRDVPEGFSWTTLLFGPLPAVFRGHWAAAVFIAICAFLTAGLANVVFAFTYNDWYEKHLRNEGFKPEAKTTPKAARPKPLPQGYVSPSSRESS